MRFNVTKCIQLKGLYVNIWFGDYIEAAYPYMERDPIVNFAAYLGAALCGAVLGWPAGGEYTSHPLLLVIL